MLDLLKRAAAGWKRHKTAQLAAALAYYAAFSISPLLLVVLAIAGLVYGHAAAQHRLDAQLAPILGAGGASTLDALLVSASHPRSGIVATVAGAVLLALGATGLILQLQGALDTIWETPDHPQGVMGALKTRARAALMVAALGVAALVSLVAAGAFGGSQYVGVPINVLALAALFIVTYKVLPRTRVRWRSAIAGGSASAIVLTAGEAVLGLYFAHFSPASAFGAAGGFVLILLWVYYSAQLSLFGAEITRALELGYTTGTGVP
ncbi:MAG TPA: YihY/virulence factor BrkB family protein [Candidatus Baltobacteraceae bacterium]